MTKSEGGGLEFMAGFVIGGIIGAVVGILMAPQSGEETRAQIAEKGIELRDEVQKRAGQLQDAVPTFVEEQRGRVEEAVERGREAAARKRQEILAQLDAQKKAGEAS
ncbi:MAG TPA: YtxH domain-containing protein [Anaerolineae bacterium]|nr:YtxH domain-containing protein [Anaerolineae bacterium]HOR00582.1 YtxH domain-containing protein [Anaerolineae bacterium]HPL30277.1 YtxH domain-containing protein [Anaerolineae bacterium]